MDGFIFILRYFWLFAVITLILVGDILFIIKSIQDFNETMSEYKRRNKDKTYLKGKFTAPIICLICNIVLILVVGSFLFYASEIIEMRKMI